MKNPTQQDQENEIDATYRTSDLNIATVLLTENCTIIKMELSASRKVFFHFINPERCKAIAEEFRFGKIKVNAKVFTEKMKSARELVYAELERGQE